MSDSTPSITETDFIRYIEDGAGRMTPRQVQQLVAELPDLREGFARMRTSAFPEVEGQLEFLAAVVEAVWTDSYREIPYRGAIEAAFAVAYFHRAVDLIPDSLGEIGLTDDAAIVQTVLARNARAYEGFAEGGPFDWNAVRPRL